MTERVEVELIADLDFDGPSSWLTLGTTYDGEPVVCDGARQSAIVTEAYFGKGVVIPADERERQQAVPISGTILRSGRVMRFSIPNPGAFFYFVQPIPASTQMLVVGSRQIGTTPNAWIVNRATVVRSLQLGDGIEDVQVTRTREVWVSRFDEGIFNNSAGPGLAAGLCKFTLEGKLEFSSDVGFPQAELPPIDDCYALNVDSAGVAWACYYAGFPLVKVVGDVATMVATAVVAGAHAFAVRGRTVLLAGSYKEPNSVFEWNVENGTTREFVPVDATGAALRVTKRAGRGTALYLMDGARVYAVPPLD